MYIKFHLKTKFIWPSKFSAVTPILFAKKPESSLWWYVNYWDLSNLIIKNQYLLPLVGEALDLLGKTMQFTQFNLTSAYYQMSIKKGNKWKTAFRT